jgi:hypothetical protein
MTCDFLRFYCLTLGAQTISFRLPWRDKSSSGIV